MFSQLVQPSTLSRMFQDSWKQKIDKAIGGIDVANDGVGLSGESLEFEQRLLTVGTIGHPNVGKSSLINSLMGKRVVRPSFKHSFIKIFEVLLEQMFGHLITLKQIGFHQFFSVSTGPWSSLLHFD